VGLIVAANDDTVDLARHVDRLGAFERLFVRVGMK